MGKKRTRKTQTSKGQRRSIVAGVKEARAGRDPWEKDMNKIKAWKKGQNPWITVDGPASNKRFIKVRANVVWGNPKNRSTGIYSKVASDD